MPRHWRTRHGLRRAAAIFFARLVREPATWMILLLAVAGSLLIAAVWWTGGIHWAGLITSLVGLAASGGTVWAVRVVASGAYGREAMGFGDVTLMAMIGAFLGWQPCLIVFFIAAPLFAIVLGVGVWIVRGESKIPYGPFLCLGSLVVILHWPWVWEWIKPHLAVAFALGWFVPTAFLVCLGLMAAILWIMRVVGDRFRSAD
jgi:prepilin signal peptidase PulO-like enzyme (type II secretory pathway)